MNLKKFLLENKEELRNDIKPDIKNFLANSSFFNGLFKQAFNKQLELFIIQQLKLNILRDLGYTLTFDEIYDTLDKEFLIKYTNNYFFDINFYKD